MEVKIEQMTAKNLEQILKIEKESFNSPWSRHSFLRDINDNSYAIYLTAKIKEKVVGYIGTWLLIDELHITNLAVDPEYRQQGIATRLLKKVIRMIKEDNSVALSLITLEVRESNRAAIKLYQKLGFSRIRVRPNYYRDNQENAIVMRKELNNE